MLSTLSFSVSQNKQKTFPVFLSSCGGVITQKGHRDTCLLLLLPQHFLFSKHPLLFLQLDRNKDGKQNLYDRLNSDVHVPYGFCHISSTYRGGSRRRLQGVHPPPLPPPKMKPSSLYSILKFVYFTNQLRHSSVLHPLLRKMLDLPLTEVHLDELCVKRMSYSIKYNMHYFGNLFCR